MQTRKLRKFQIVEAECKEFVAEGLGLSYIKADPEAYKPLTGFVWGVLPGERFLAKVMKVRSNHFHATLLPSSEIPEDWIGKESSTPMAGEDWALFEKSPKRVKPPCDNFILCGGCKMMHMTYEDTLFWKRRWFEIQLERNKVEDTGEIKIEGAQNPYHYRNHVQIHINKHKERGFYAPGSYRTVPFPSHGCRIFQQNLVDENFPEKYELERCVRVRINAATQTSLCLPLNSGEDKTARFTYSLAYPEQSITRVTIPNTAFFQINLSFIPVWLQKIEKFYERYTQKIDEKVRVLELFSGVGFISKMLSYTKNLESMGVDILKAQDVEKTEIQNDRAGKSPLEDFQKNYICRDLNRLNEMPAEEIEKIRRFNPHLLIINPPRGGFLPEQIRFLLEEILEKKLPIIFSSCNGATLARDIAYLSQKGYRMEDATVLDFFPWTSHYEILTGLVSGL